MVDVTFIPTRAGWLYLAVLIDLHTRLIVGWSMKDRPNQELVNEALLMAWSSDGPSRGSSITATRGFCMPAGVM